MPHQSFSYRKRGPRARNEIASGARRAFAVITLALLSIDSTPLRADELISPASSRQLQDLGSGICQLPATSKTLLLFDAIERALCSSPKTRSTWAAIKEATADLNLSKSAYYPSVSADVRYLYQHNVTEAQDVPSLESDYTKAVNEESVSLSWVLYDFGARSASVRGSRQLILAARANQDQILQSVFVRTAQDYLSAQAAHASAEAARAVEEAAEQNLKAAFARAQEGVAPVTDELQAKTAAAQSTFERVRAEGALRTSLGSLAIDMSLSPDERLLMPESDNGVLPNAEFSAGVHDLLIQAQKDHPRVLAAAAQWQAALANVQFAQQRDLPNLRLVGESDRSNQPVSASLGQPVLPALSKQSYIGLRIEIPLFDGFARHNKIQAAQADADLKEQALRDIQQEVATAVWTSVQTLDTDTENLRNTELVLDSARQAFQAAEERYRGGVGTIIETLTAQRTLSGAEQQSIEARLEWRIARLNLAASLGHFDKLDIP